MSAGQLKAFWKSEARALREVLYGLLDAAKVVVPIVAFLVLGYAIGALG
jgi:hypothetical protein